MTRQVRKAFETLTVTQQQVVVLYGIDGQPAATAGRHLGMPADAVRAIFAGACQRMAQFGTRQAVTR